MVHVIRHKIRSLYAWFTGWADKPQAETALVNFTVAEAIIFPIPPDPLLIALVFAKAERWWRLALKTTIASIFGGIVGYLVGVGLFETLGQWLLDTLGGHDEYIELGERFREGTFLAVLAAALTPIPYKLITLSAGAFGVNFGSFLLASILGRGLRFFGVSYLARYLGRKHKDKIEQYIDIISIIVVVLVVLLFLLAG
jgi:membrane protein YqaA with SNARE-associated domain